MRQLVIIILLLASPASAVVIDRQVTLGQSYFIGSLIVDKTYINDTIISKKLYVNDDLPVVVNPPQPPPVLNETPPVINITPPVNVTPPANETPPKPPPLNLSNSTPKNDTPVAENCTPRRVISHEYMPVEQIYSELSDIPGVSEETIGHTVEGRPIKAFSLGYGRTFLFDGRLHGIEDCGALNGLYFVKWASTQELKAKIIFIPGINLDNKVGRINAHDVDLNRNFPHGWIPTPNDGYAYSGESPASEPETKAMVAFLDKTRPDVFMDVHCGQRLARFQEMNSLAWNIQSEVRRLDAIRGTNAYGKYGVRQIGTATHGYIIATAQDYATTSLLLESDTWDSLPSTPSCYESEEWPDQRVLYQAILNSIS